MQLAAPLVLASASPRRKELLTQLGYEFTAHALDIDETPIEGELAADYVERMAREKAQAGLRLYPESQVLGSDTIVVLEGKILGKPRDKAHCIEMLTSLSGREHQVMTAIALCDSEHTQSEVITTRVVFGDISDAEILDYWHSGEPADKAGSYGIQGLGGKFVIKIDGSYSAVVGLPLYETHQMISQFNQRGML